MTGSRELAADVLTEVFVHVWEQSSSDHSQYGSVYAWLAALCRAKGTEKLRATNQRRKGQEGESASSRGTSEGEQKSAAAETIVAFKGYAEEVRNSLRTLSKLELRLLELSYYEGQSQSDLARMLRIPLGTIKAKMRRGIQKLRQASAQEVK